MTFSLLLCLFNICDVHFLCSKHIHKSCQGYTPIMTPDLVRSPVVHACGFQPRGEASQVVHVSRSLPLCHLFVVTMLCRILTYYNIFVLTPLDLSYSASQVYYLDEQHSTGAGALCLAGTAEIPMGGDLFLSLSLSFFLSISSFFLSCFLSLSLFCITSSLYCCAGMFLNAKIESSKPLKYVAFGHAFRCEAGNAINVFFSNIHTIA